MKEVFNMETLILKFTENIISAHIACTKITKQTLTPEFQNDIVEKLQNPGKFFRFIISFSENPCRNC